VGWYISTVSGLSRESIIIGWLYLRCDPEIGLIDSLSCRLPPLLKFVAIGGG
jgi:hypothetical protein